MNKRQKKKREQKLYLMQDLSYKEARILDRSHHEYLIYYNHTHKIFKGFDEDELTLIEMGIFTQEEALAKMEGNDDYKK